MPDAKPNPYATSDLPPVRGYWPRFWSSLKRAAKFYRRQVRREGVSLREEIVAWLTLLLLFVFVLGLIAMLLYALWRVRFPA